MTVERAVPEAGVAALQIVSVLPLLGVFLATLVIVGGWIVGATPFWPVPELTLSEAVLTKDAGEVVRLIERERADPNRRWPVRSELLSPASSVTPLEAAVIIRRSEMIPLLLQHGAILPTGEERDALICRGVASAAGEIVDFLLTTGEKTDPRGRCASISSSH